MGLRRESRSPLLVAVAALLLALALLAPVARADVAETIILRCTHNQSLSGFSQRAYEEALKELSADSEEYSDCSALIQQAELQGAGTNGGGVPGASAGPVAVVPTRAQERAITHAVHHGSTPVDVGNETIQPGVVHADVASALSSLPTPVLALLGFVLALLLLIAAGFLRNRVRAGRSG